MIARVKVLGNILLNCLYRPVHRLISRSVQIVNHQSHKLGTLAFRCGFRRGGLCCFGPSRSLKRLVRFFGKSVNGQGLPILKHSEVFDRQVSDGIALLICRNSTDDHNIDRDLETERRGASHSSTVAGKPFSLSRSVGRYRGRRTTSLLTLTVSCESSGNTSSRLLYGQLLG